MTGLEAALTTVARALDQLGIPYMVIGGYAASIWGEPRLTQDLDVTIPCEADEADVVHQLSRLFTPRTRSAVEFVRLKMISPRPRDREDVRGIVRRRGRRLERAYLDPIVADLAQALAQPDILEFYRSLWDT